MRIVVDTNVVVSAILRDRTPEKVLLFIVGRPDFEWVASEEILDEYRAVLRRPKFALPADLLARWDERFQTSIGMWSVHESASLPRDEKDAKFLACALAADADFLITGDQDFTEARRLGRTKIVSVSLFQQLVCQPMT